MWSPFASLLVAALLVGSSLAASCGSAASNSKNAEDNGSGEAPTALINAYNAYTLNLIIQHYPDIESIQAISKPWSTEKYGVGGHTLSLDQIEHGLIRPLYRDPRIHFAVNCAAIDCPYLAEAAYTGESIDAQLEKRTKAILTNEQFVRVEDDKLRYPRVMKWYRFDFVDSSFKDNAPNIAQYIDRYAEQNVTNFVEQNDGDPSAMPFDYDWSLNDAD